MLSHGVLIFSSILVASVVLSVLLSFYLMYDSPFRKINSLVSRKTVKVVVTVIFASKIANSTSFFQSGRRFTDFVYSIEGSAVAVFQTFTPLFLDIFFIFVYLVVYFVLIILTYFKLHLDGIDQALNYVRSYVFLILISAPFFHFMPVEVTGYYLEGVSPILYEFHPYIYDGITTFDPLTKALPSLHTGFSVLALAYSYKYTEKFKYYAGIAAVTVIFSTFYLGVHWITDAVLGAFMAAIAFYIGDRGYLESRIITDRDIKKIDNFLTKSQ